jgi:hypothetical protein
MPLDHAPLAAGELAPITGIGLRTPHIDEVMDRRPAVPWLEVHTENYLGEGYGTEVLDLLHHDYRLSLHGVGLSLGGAERPDRVHLARIAAAMRRFQPALVSEHLSWSRFDGTYFNDLLPLPWTEESLDLFCDHVDETQVLLGRQILIENPSSYLRFEHSTLLEVEFLNEVVARTGCGVLCDVNNVFVSAHNLGFNAMHYLDALRPDAVREIHLAGHARNELDDGAVMLIDDHGSRVAPNVWVLYAHAVARFGAVPTVVEWDTELPALDVLLAQAASADTVAAAVRQGAAHAR